MPGSVTEIDTPTFKEVVASGETPVLVDFWAPWCGPCKAIAPILEEIANELGEAARIYKVNVDDNQELAHELGIRAIPTLLVYRNGKQTEQLVGVSSKEDIKAKLS